MLLSPDGPPAIDRPAEQAQQPAAKTAAVQPVAIPAPVQPAAKPPDVPQPAPVQPPPQRVPEPAPQASEAPAAYKFLGKNGKKITILVQSPTVPFLPDNQLSFLTKILEACRMNIGDVAIVNTATASVNIATLKQQLQPTAILLFGLEPTAIKLPINFPEFKVQPYDSCSYLSAPPLTRLVAQSEESKLLKSKLWVCLKTLFNV